jgi:hypothetical protein
MNIDRLQINRFPKIHISVLGSFLGMTNMYKEELPESCPPKDANDAKGIVFYRFINEEIATQEDFYSHRKLFPLRKFHVDECQARSVSVQINLEDALNTKKLNKSLSNKRIGQVTINVNSGVYKQTGKAGHYSWWIFNEYQPESQCAALPEPQGRS